MVAILLDHFHCLKSVRFIQNFHKSLSSLVSQSRCTRVYFETGVYYHAQIEERVSMVDKKKVDSLLLIPQSPLAVVSAGTEHPSVQLMFCSQLRRTVTSRDVITQIRFDVSLEYFTRRNGTSAVS